MKTQAISFKGKKERVEFKNTPESFETNRNVFETIAKKNKVDLSIYKSIENKYLPTSDAYIVLATKKKSFKHGIGCVITDKKTDNKTLLEKIIDSTQKAISQTIDKSSKKPGFIRRIINFFTRK